MCYGRIAPRSGLAAKKHFDIGAGVIDKDYCGEMEMVMFNHSEEDLPVRMRDRITQLILEEIRTPEVKKVADLDDTVRGSGGFGSTGTKETSQIQNKDPSRVSMLQKVQGKPHIKRTSTAQQKRQLISVKQMQKLMKKKENAFLCIIRPDDKAPRGRRSRGKRGNKSVALGSGKAQVSLGMTE